MTLLQASPDGADNPEYIKKRECTIVCSIGKNKNKGGSSMYFAKKFSNRPAFAALSFFIVALVLFAGIQLRTVAAQEAKKTTSSNGKIAEAKQAFNEEIRKAKMAFDDAIQQAKKEYRATVAQAKKDAKAVKEASSEEAKEIRQAGADAVRAAKAKLKSAQKTAKEDWRKAKETAKKKYDEAVSRP